jgi:hypothetical protein
MKWCNHFPSTFRQVILGGIVGATLLSIAIASQVVSTDRRDEPRRQMGRSSTKMVEK